MGTIQHRYAIAVVTYHHETAAAAFERVKDFAATQEDPPLFSDFTTLLSRPVRGVVNMTTTYFMAPDGSKEGWSTSDIGDKIRNFFISEMSEAGADVVHGAFGELGLSFARVER